VTGDCHARICGSRGLQRPRRPGKVPELLYISVRTIETHRANIMRKLGLTTRAGLVRYAIAAGLFERRRSDPS
jgi:Bacterial regulatory proteins, luxR family